MIINQWVPAAHRGDAIGDSARRVRDMLRAAGHQSDIFALTIDDDLRDESGRSRSRRRARAHITIFHFALPSPMTEAFASLHGRRVLQYHNITPASFFAPYDAAAVQAGRARTAGAPVAGRPRRSGARRLRVQPSGARALGFTPTGVMPIAVNTERITNAPRRPALEKILGDGLINILFVGRIVPNKRIEDHIRLAEIYKRYIDSYYRFIFVGRYDGLPRYHAMVRALIVQYQMLPERFVFTGGVPDDDLAAYYRWADAYVSLSEHEGFCVPLVEAWPPTCRCWPMRPARCPKRSAAPASCSRRRTSSSRRRCSERSYTIGRCASACSKDSGGASAISRPAASKHG